MMTQATWVAPVPGSEDPVPLPVVPSVTVAIVPPVALPVLGVELPVPSLVMSADGSSSTGGDCLLAPLLQATSDQHGSANNNDDASKPLNFRDQATPQQRETTSSPLDMSFPPHN
jgi:hypothetical protein